MFHVEPSRIHTVDVLENILYNIEAVLSLFIKSCFVILRLDWGIRSRKLSGNLSDSFVDGSTSSP
jgi:hypothetical protein